MTAEPYLILAHRGAWGPGVPENSCAAFSRARELGADGVEMDVIRCGSGELVVFHDDTVGRLTGRSGRVADMSFAELRALDLGGGERIPTLEEAVEASGPEAVLNVELKCAEWDDRGLAAEAARAIGAMGIGERCIVSSFNPLVLARFRARQPRVRVAYLFGASQAWHYRRGLWALPVRAYAVHPEAPLCTPTSVRRWKRLGMRVNTWTVDDPARAAELGALGVDGIITNQPALIRSSLRSGR